MRRGVPSEGDIAVMHYIVAIAWIVFILYEFRCAHAKHVVAKQLQEMSERLAHVEVGMSPREVQVLLGNPVRVDANRKSLTWQYRIAREFRNVIFSDGKVTECDRPSQPVAGEL
jgi:outer membrane protein assembly factor BamE (lipoprotein component of BamABCDE complex)